MAATVCSPSPRTAASTAGDGPLRSPPLCRRPPRVQTKRQRTAGTLAALGPQLLADLGDLGVDGGSLLDGPLLPLAGVVGVVLAGSAGLKVSTYSQLEYIVAAMLARYVRPGGARVLQLGGSTRDLFYYPQGTVQVAVAAEGLSIALWEQAGMQAKVPVHAIKAPAATALAAQPGSSVDAVVVLGCLPAGGERSLQEFTRGAHRVLRPGGTLVFVQRVRGEGLAAVVQPLVGGAAQLDAEAINTALETGGSTQPWDFVQWDLALEALDPHAVGVAVKPLKPRQGTPESVDTAAFEQLLKSSKGRQLRGGGGGGGKGGDKRGFGQ